MVSAWLMCDKLSLAICHRKVVEQEEAFKEMHSGKMANLSRFSGPHSKCSALKYTNGSI